MGFGYGVEFVGEGRVEGVDGRIVPFFGFVIERRGFAEGNHKEESGQTVGKIPREFFVAYVANIEERCLVGEGDGIEKHATVQLLEELSAEIQLLQALGAVVEVVSGEDEHCQHAGGKVTSGTGELYTPVCGVIEHDEAGVVLHSAQNILHLSQSGAEAGMKACLCSETILTDKAEDIFLKVEGFAIGAGIYWFHKLFVVLELVEEIEVVTDTVRTVDGADGRKGMFKDGRKPIKGVYEACGHGSLSGDGNRTRCRRWRG